MQKWISVLTAGVLFFGFSLDSFAAKKKATVNQMGAKLGTDFHFDPLSVQGRYETAFQGFATVEDEKILNKIIDYRTDFKQRLLESKYLR